MKLTNLHLIIAAIIMVYAMTLGSAWALPGSVDTIEKLANLVLGGLLAIMRPPSQAVPV